MGQARGPPSGILINGDLPESRPVSLGLCGSAMFWSLGTCISIFVIVVIIIAAMH